MVFGGGEWWKTLAKWALFTTNKLLLWQRLPATLANSAFKGPKNCMSRGCKTWEQCGGKHTSVGPSLFAAAITSAMLLCLTKVRSRGRRLQVCMMTWANHFRKSSPSMYPAGMYDGMGSPSMYPAGDLPRRAPCGPPWVLGASGEMVIVDDEGRNILPSRVEARQN